MSKITRVIRIITRALLALCACVIFSGCNSQTGDYISGTLYWLDSKGVGHEKAYRIQFSVNPVGAGGKIARSGGGDLNCIRGRRR
jgi:hypothetical protein